MDEELTALFQQWLITFEKTQSATGDEEAVAALALTRIESRIATTPAQGLHGLVVKLGLDRFLHEEIALFNIEGSFFALDNACTHEEGPLAEGEIEGHEVTCPWAWRKVRYPNGRGPLRTGIWRRHAIQRARHGR
jgi:nitrite reductase/ring-hydroxylating ferredoxin subunit